MTHQCKEIREGYSILKFENITWTIIHDIDDSVFITGISFCPWCGAKLEETS